MIKFNFKLFFHVFVVIPCSNVKKHYSSEIFRFRLYELKANSKIQTSIHNVYLSFFWILLETILLSDIIYVRDRLI